MIAVPSAVRREVEDYAVGVGVNSSTNTVYVANINSSGAVSVIDGATNTVTATLGARATTG